MTRTPSNPPATSASRVLGAAGSALAAVAVALAAYAAHGAEGVAQLRLAQAAAFGFGHGLALAALAPFADAGIGRIALATMLAGVLLFSGSLAGGGLLGWSTALAPFGGTLMLLGWLLHGWHRLRG